MKYFRSLITLSVLGIAALSASSQKMAGEWKKYQVIKPYIQRVISTPDNLYYLCTDRLFVYDTATNKSRNIGEKDGLTIGDISAIKYNTDKGYLALGSYDGSLSIVYDDGKISNLKAIKNLSVATTRTIRDIDFLGDDIYLATDFGLVVVDASKCVVKNYTRPSSNIYSNKSFTSVVAVPGYALGVCNQKLYCIPTDSRMTDMSNLKDMNLALGNVELYGRGDGTFYASTYPDNANSSSQKFLRLYKFDVSTTPACTLVNDYSLTPKSHIWVKDNIYMIAIEDNGGVATYNVSDNYQSIKLERTEDFRLSTDYVYDPESSMKWISTDLGVEVYRNGTKLYTFKAEMDDDYTSVEAISIMYPSIDRNRIYISTRSSSYKWKTGGKIYNPELYSRRPLSAWQGWILSMQEVDAHSDAYGFFCPSYVNMISNGNIIDVSNYDPTNHYGNKNKVNQDNGGYWIYALQAMSAFGTVATGGEGLAENPNKPGQYWHATNAEGLYVIDSGNELRLLSNETGSLKTRNQWGTQILDVKFDKEGNVWILDPTVNRADLDASWGFPKLPAAVLQMLPASKALDVESITADDWKEANKLPVGTAETAGQIEGRLTVTLNRVNNGGTNEYIFIKPLLFKAEMVVYCRKSTGESVEEDYPLFIDKYVDQNGNEYSPGEMIHIEEDLSGRVWICNPYVFGYFDPKTELPEGTTTMPIVVPSDIKRGGSPVDNAFITGVSQSPIDKTLWVASQGNGLFHLSADGTEQLDNFRTSNSILTTDILGAVCVDASGDVYIGSQKGLFRYRPAHGAAASDLSNVTVAPATAKDDYNGAFTISNLTDACRVSIKDAAGNILFEGVADGGTLIWNGLDKSGKRVTTGIYNIFGNAEENPVAKIIVLD